MEKKQWQIELEAEMAEKDKFYFVLNPNGEELFTVSAKNEVQALEIAKRDGQRVGYNPDRLHVVQCF